MQHLFNNILLLLPAKPRINGQADHFLIKFLRLRAARAAISVLLIIRMPVYRNIMNIYPDSGIPQTAEYFCTSAVTDPDNIQMPAALHSFRDIWDSNARMILKRFLVTSCDIAPLFQKQIQLVHLAITQR